MRLYAARSVELAPYQDVLGRIAESFEASFIILDRGIFTIDVEEIDQTVLQQTWIRGQKVYEGRCRRYPGPGAPVRIGGRVGIGSRRAR